MLLFDLFKWRELLFWIASGGATPIWAQRHAIVLIVPHLIFQHEVACRASLALNHQSIKDRAHVPVKFWELIRFPAQAIGARWLLIWIILLLLIYCNLDTWHAEDFLAKAAINWINGDADADLACATIHSVVSRSVSYAILFLKPIGVPLHPD